jgi:hypothetical protein
VCVVALDFKVQRLQCVCLCGGHIRSGGEEYVMLLSAAVIPKGPAENQAWSDKRYAIAIWQRNDNRTWTVTRICIYSMSTFKSRKNAM